MCEYPTIPQGIGEGVKKHSPFRVERYILHFSPVFCNAEYRGETEETAVSRRGVRKIAYKIFDCRI